MKKLISMGNNMKKIVALIMLVLSMFAVQTANAEYDNAQSYIEYENGKLVVSGTFVNTHEEEKTYTVILAEYNSDGKMVNIPIYQPSVTMSSGENTFYYECDTDIKEMNVKLFVYDEDFNFISVNARPNGQPIRLTNEAVKSINHRGWYEAPENTLSAYRLSANKGFTYVECDVLFTSDNVPVLIHSTTIDNTSNGTGYVDSMTFEKIRQYDFGSWKSDEYAGELIPSFEEFIAFCRQYSLRPYIDLKNNATMTDKRIQILTDIVAKYGMQNIATWISPNPEILRKISDIYPKARLSLLANKITQTEVDSVLSLKNDTNDVFINSLHSKLTDDLVNLCIDNDIPLEVWTLDGEKNIKALNPYISGVTSNYTIANDVLGGLK